VFRAERPQKGRYRQFIQCDIDIIGDSTTLAELELISASLAALNAMGVKDATIRVNHRVVLKQAISDLGISDQDSLSAMITIDKLDKVGIEGVCAELTEKFGEGAGERAHKWLSSLGGAVAPEELSYLFDAEFAANLRFDPTLVRGMGYYTGAIFEIEHPESSSSIGGGGRYDGMVGKWLGTDVPAVGISLGIERIVDLVEVSPLRKPGLVLLIDSESQALDALALQYQLVGDYRVRIEVRPKNLKALLAELAADFDFFANAANVSDSSLLDIKELS
jgi:histidyl-tRNA synthetase